MVVAAGISAAGGNGLRAIRLVLCVSSVAAMCGGILLNKPLYLPGICITQSLFKGATNFFSVSLLLNFIVRF